VSDDENRNYCIHDRYIIGSAKMKVLSAGRGVGGEKVEDDIDISFAVTDIDSNAHEFKYEYNNQ
jgi:hypothetical protein